MKNLIIIATFFILKTSVLFSQCPTMALTITTQSEIDNFSVDYPNCVNLDQTLFVDGDDVTNLNGLSALQEIDYFIVKNSSVIDLSGLENLVSVTGNFTIEFNDNLTSLSGLENLEELGSLRINSNENLTTISQLSNLEAINESLSISGNPALVNLSGLENCSLDGVSNGTGNVYLSIVNNDALTSLEGIPNPLEIDGNLNISFNDNLVNFDALSNLTRIESTCNIAHNSSLSSLESLNNLTYCENLNVKNNPILQNLQGLNSLDSIFYRLDVSDNSGLVDLSGLEELSYLKTIWIRNNSITSLTGLENVSAAIDIWIEENHGLSSMDGLNGLLDVTEKFEIEYNNGLINLMGLENLSQVGTANSNNSNFEIIGNESLQTLNGLSGLSSLNANLAIILNPSLLNLSGLENLTNSKYIAIRNNDTLTSLAALSNLATIETCLFVVNNNSLTSIMDLTSLTSIPTNKFEFSNNPQLSFCHVDIVCQLIEEYPSKIDIEDNAVGCFDSPEVLTFCDCAVYELYYPDTDDDDYGDINADSLLVCEGTPPPDDYVLNNSDCDDNNSNINPDASEIPNNGIDEDCDGEDLISSVSEIDNESISVFPNPTKGAIVVREVELRNAWLYLYNTTGELLLKLPLEDEKKLDLTLLPASIYLLNIQHEEGVFMTRVVKVGRR